MLLSRQHQFLFIHVPKTAGTSITSVLVSHCRFVDRLVYGDSPTSKIIGAINYAGGLVGRRNIANQILTGFPSHATIRLAEKKISSDLYDKLFKFGFVRNPWDREVSEYFHIISSSRASYHEVVKDMTFPEFVRWHLNKKPKRQCDFICDSSDEIALDYVGRFEDINSELKLIRDKIGVDFPSINHLNRSQKRSSRDYRRYYDSESIERVTRYYRRDAELFDYQFDR